MLDTIINILLFAFILWIAIIVGINLYLYYLFNPKKQRNWVFFAELIAKRLFRQIFNFKQLKKEIDTVRVARILSLNDLDMDKIFPTGEQLEWLLRRIMSNFTTEYLKSGNYVDTAIRPFWALMAVMVDEKSNLHERMPIMDKVTKVNVSMIYLHARDQAVKELNGRTDCDWEGHIFDQPMFYWLARNVNIEPREDDPEYEYFPRYVIDTTRPTGKTND